MGAPEIDNDLVEDNLSSPVQKKKNNLFEPQNFA